MRSACCPKFHGLPGRREMSLTARTTSRPIRAISAVTCLRMGSVLPWLLLPFGDTNETIRTFHADTQRSLYPVKEIRLLPGREFPMDDVARAAFRSRWREVFEGDPSRSAIYKDIGNGIAS